MRSEKNYANVRYRSGYKNNSHRNTRHYNPNYRKPQKKNRGKGRTILLIIIILLLVIASVYLYKNLTGKTYDDEVSYKSFADKYFSDIQTSSKVGEDMRDYSYGQPVSTACNYPKLGVDGLDEQIKETCENLANDYQGKYEDKDPNEKYTQLTGYSSYKNDKEIGAVALISTDFSEETTGKFTQKKQRVSTFNYDIKNGGEVYPVLAFQSGYQEKLSKYITQYVEEEYKGKLVKDYKKNLSADNNKFDKFVLTDDGAVFYFDSDTIVDSNEAISVEVESSKIKDLFREEISTRNIDRTKPMVAITFDDGPAAGSTDKILDVLEDNKAVATFFELGENVENVKNADKMLQREEKIGCEVASHSYSHPNLFKLTDAQVKEENELTDKAIKKAIGHAPTLYRPPYGNGNENITKIFNKSGILWSLDTLDWSSRNADSVFNVVKNSGDLDGKVILMHSIYDSTAEAVKKMVPWLQNEGYQLVTVSEMLIYKYKQDPADNIFCGYNYFYPDEDKK